MEVFFGAFLGTSQQKPESYLSSLRRCGGKIHSWSKSPFFTPSTSGETPSLPKEKNKPPGHWTSAEWKSLGWERPCWDHAAIGTGPRWESDAARWLFQIFYFLPYLERWSNLINVIFQYAWNHQLGWHLCWQWDSFWHFLHIGPVGRWLCCYIIGCVFWLMLGG